MSLNHQVAAVHDDPPDGHLLDELGYLTEIQAAAGLGLTPKTLIEYRKRRVGPHHVELARRVYYSRQALADWLAAGGARETEE